MGALSMHGCVRGRLFPETKKEETRELGQVETVQANGPKVNEAVELKEDYFASHAVDLHN